MSTDNAYLRIAILRAMIDDTTDYLNQYRQNNPNDNHGIKILQDYIDKLEKEIAALIANLKG